MTIQTNTMAGVIRSLSMEIALSHQAFFSDLFNHNTSCGYHNCNESTYPNQMFIYIH